jgi:hypothetical protein
MIALDRDLRPIPRQPVARLVLAVLVLAQVLTVANSEPDRDRAGISGGVSPLVRGAGLGAAMVSVMAAMS